MITTSNANGKSGQLTDVGALGQPTNSPSPSSGDQALVQAAAIRLAELESVNYMDLPRLPIPELSQTLRTLLDFCRVLDDDEKFSALASKVQEFEDVEGPKLQKDLVTQDDHEGYPFSFIQKTWDDAYLSSRQAHPINVSPFFALNPKKVSGTGQTAAFVKAIVDWTIQLRAGVRHESLVGQGLCASAMGKLFATAKIPQQDRDHICRSVDSNNIVIACKGNLLSVPVIQAGKAVSAEVIASAIQMALAQPESLNPLGVLTTADRDQWARMREQLCALDAKNEALFQKIDDAIVVLSVDVGTEQAMPDQFSSDHLAKSLLTGNADSRWFDKLQVILHESSGRVGLNFEHSCSDGTNWINFIQDCTDAMAADNDLSHAETSQVEISQMETIDVDPGDAVLRQNALQPQWLEFNVPDAVSKAIDVQQAVWQQASTDVDTKVLTYETWGKSFAKSQGVSPDALVQMAFQLAHYRLKGEMAPTYESAQMRRFFSGRTDTIRACSEAAKAFVQDWQKGEGSIETLVAAAKQHSAHSKQVATGNGIDRHLLALQTLAAEQGVSVPLFDDPLYKQSSTWVLSTSNASHPDLELFGFGPVCSEGFGLGYLIQPESVSVNVTAFKSAGNSAADFAQTLSQVFDDIYTAFSMG